MVATPVFTAPIVDRLTGDSVQSLRDSRLASTPMWAVDWYRGDRLPQRFDHRLYALIAFEGLLARKPIDFRDTTGSPPLPDTAFFMGLGGSHDTVWMVDSVNNKLYKVDPRTWSILRSRTAPHPSVGTSPRSIGGDSQTAWFWNFWPRSTPPNWNAHNEYTLYRLDGTTLEVAASSRFRYLQSVGGDSTVAWGIHRDVNTGDNDREFRQAQLIRIGLDLSVEDSIAMPLRDDPTARDAGFDSRHKAIAIAGSQHNIHLLTFNVDSDRYWLHRLSPTTYAITHTYGPFEGDRPLRDIGGN